VIPINMFVLKKHAFLKATPVFFKTQTFHNLTGELLEHYKNAATMAISFLQEDFDCPYTFTKNYTQYCCDRCYNAFKEMDFSKDSNVCTKHRKLIKSAPNEKARAISLCALIKNSKYCKNDADQAENDADPIKIAAIKEELRLKLTPIASKLLSSEDFHFYNLSEEE
jgi:hypothetical protein